MTHGERILEDEWRIGALPIAGRLVKTATAETRATEDGFVTDELLAFYEPIVDAGTPLIISGNLYTTASGKSSYRMTAADDPDKIPGLRRLTDLAHQGGVKIFAQVNHCGRQVIPSAMGMETALSASAVSDKLMGTKPRPLTEPEIQEIIDSLANAATYCQAAGFDGLQLHAGHGYLFNQFLTPYTNRRKDGYGGDLNGRMRFLLEAFRAVRERVGEEFPVIIKLNGHDALFWRRGLDTRDLIEIARILQEEGIDGIEVTVGHYESLFPMIRGRFDTYFAAIMHEGFGHQLPASRRLPMTVLHYPVGLFFNRLRKHYEGFNLEYAEQFKKSLSIPIICVGGFLTKPAIEGAIRDGRCDAVSVGRAMISDPYLYQHLREDVQGPQCSFCNGCIARWGTLPVDCYDVKVRPV
jgi:2,4-dienoyl-CoA reductase-like NADH-dependent reductase (Old Yellow Enzyme family)